ncbi:MAG: hypothetical protein ABI540_01720 [Spartobacteria bacterium]
MKIPLAVFLLVLAGCASAPPKPYQVEKVQPLPVALDPVFEFRKIIQYFLDPTARPVSGQVDAAVAFERGYRMYGAITALDQHQRYGNYYAFFWAARRPADVRVRLEYRQEKLHAFVQAREVRYPHAQGHYQTDFAIIGDDFFDDGRVLSWRASLIVDGRIVAMRRSYLWE